MLDLSRARNFRLRQGGIWCDRDGLFVGSTPLLLAGENLPAGLTWTVRPESELNSELSACYGLPIETSSKIGGLMCVARALSKGDLAMAAIIALHLQFPDPPPVEKAARSPDDWSRLAADLVLSGLFKDEWEPDKHPRTGEPPNPGWFAPVPTEEKAPRPGWPPPRASQAIRRFLKGLAEKAALGMAGPEGDAAAFFLTVLENLTPTELNTGEERITAQWKANFDPPKTLEELQVQPTENILGYEQHHVVEQNPANVEKRELEKFGREKLDDPSNLVWVPRLKHERISGYYSEVDKNDPQGRTRRDVFKEMDFDGQRAIGLEQLRALGVLK